MKRNILAWAICVLLYLMQLPFLGFIIASLTDVVLSETVKTVVLVFCFAVFGMVVLLIIFNLIVSFVGTVRSFSPLATTLKVKLALIPFFIINFIIWVLFLVGTFNPFLFLLGPLVLAISISVTYLFVIGSGIQNIIYLSRRCLAHRQLKCALFVVLHFIFIADVVAAALAYYYEKKSEKVVPDAVSCS